MDDFERRLSVALKTSVRDLPAAAPTTAEALPVSGRPPTGRRVRPRILLAATVVVLLVLGVGGTWWAISGAHARHAAPAGDACTESDVTAAPLPTQKGFFAVIGLRARTACTVASTPVLTLDDRPIWWRTADPDAVDPARWVPFAIPAGGEATFGLTISYNTVANCPAAYEQQLPLRFGLDAHTALATIPFTVVLSCASFAFTTIDPAPPTPVDASTPCTAADLDVVPHDVGAGIDAVGIDVVAKVGCTLQQSPDVTVDGTATTSDIRGNTAPPWSPTRLAEGQSVTLEVNPNYLGDCTSYGTRHVVATLGGAALVDFTWTTVIECPGTGFGLEVRQTGAYVERPCTAADVDMTPTLGESVATLRFSARSDATCTLVDPPTVTTGTDLAPFGLDDDLHTFGGWTGRTVGPGQDVILEISADPHHQACNGQERSFHHAFDVTVTVAAATVGSFPWTYVGCGDTVVTTIR